jgi:hypothetical protein
MANRDNPSGFRWYGSLVGAPPTVRSIVLAGTVAQGDTLVQGTATATIGLSNSGNILGVACEDGVSGETINYYVATDWDLFEAQCEGTYSTSYLNQNVDIEGTTGIQEVNEDASTEGVFRILGLVEDGVNAAGANARVYGIFVRGLHKAL